MGARTSVLPDLLSQASPATPPRHDRSTSEEVRKILFDIDIFIPQLKLSMKKFKKKKYICFITRNVGLVLITSHNVCKRNSIFF